MKTLINHLKKNWLNWLLSLIAALSSADAAVGIRDGKSPMNLAVIPSLVVAAGASGVLGVRWLNTRTVTAVRNMPGLDPEFVTRLERLYAVAQDPDVSADQAAHLADIAGDLLLALHRRSDRATIQMIADSRHLPKPVSPSGG